MVGIGTMTPTEALEVNGNILAGLKEDPAALSNLGHTIGRTTIADILRQQGIEPARAQLGGWFSRFSRQRSSPNTSAFAVRSDALALIRLDTCICSDTNMLRSRTDIYAASGDATAGIVFASGQMRDFASR
jgi:hypothetical protein